MKRTLSLRRLNTRLRLSITELATGGKWSLEFSRDTQHNLRSFFFDGVTSSASDSIVLTYMPLYLLALGASNADVGLMTSLASFSAVLLLLPGAALTDRTGKRKGIVLISSGVIRRIALLIMAFVPFFFKRPAAIYILIFLKVIMDGMSNLGIPAWTSLTADIIPISWRGRYFGARNMAMGIAAMVSTYAIGLIITGIGSPQGYQWALGLAFGFGVLSTFFFSHISETALDTNNVLQETKSNYSFKALRSILRADQNFMIFCAYTAIWTFSLNIAGPFFSVYMVQDLKATAAIVGLTTIISKLASLPAQRYFGGFADKWGSRRLMLITGLIIPILPILWFFTREPWHVYPINLLGGIAWAGYGIASFNFLLSVSPAENRARYTAIYHIAVAGSTALGAALGGLVGNIWSLSAVFLLSGIGRFVAAGIFARFVHIPQGEQTPLSASG